MDSSDTLTPTTSSTVTSSSDTSSDPSQNSHLLEITLISAQDLPQVSKSMHTYAVVWIHPKRKLTSSIDQQGHTNPTWNDRFAFYVNDEFLMSDCSAMTIEIYNTSSWFKDVLVGTVCVFMSDLITASAINNPRFVALQIRRPSGKFQGKLNMGVSLMDDSNESRLPYLQINPTEDSSDILKQNGDIFEENQPEEGNDEDIKEFPKKDGSIINGSIGNGSELCSDVGPSASIVAAEIARRSIPRQPVAGSVRWRRAKEVEDIGSSIVEEMTMKEATAKGLTSNVTRLRKQVPFPPKYDGDYDTLERKSRRAHTRRHSDGGLFSCFANAYGFEFTIVCGASSKPNFKESVKTQKKRLTGSEANSA